MLRHQARYEHLLAKPLGRPSLFTFEPMDTISPSPSRLEWISERLNPVLIKEVRQALRGASFRNVYLVTLILIGVVGTTVLLNLGLSNDAGGGRIYGTAVVGCLCVGLIGLVPLVAFQSISGEWEEDTYDLLILSDLSPFQVVFGKLLSCAVQIVLMLAAFAPVVAVGLVLQGLDPVAVLFLSLFLPFVSLGLCCLAMAVAAHCRMRMIRVMAMGLVALGLALVTMGMASFQSMILDNPDEIQDWDFIGITGLTSLAGITFSALAFCAAMVRFTHEEDNSSTSARLVLAFGALGAVAMGIALDGRGGFSPEEFSAILFMLFMFGYPAFLGFSTEPTGLGRRTAQRLKGKRWAFLRVPFLPGADRGVLYLLTLSLLMGLPLFLYARAAAPTASGAPGAIASLGRNDPLAPLLTLVVCVAYLLFYIGLPALLLRPFCKTANGRWRVRLMSITFLLAGIMMPMAAGMFVGDRDLGQGRHVFNPVWAVGKLIERGGSIPNEVMPIIFLGSGVALLYLLRLPKAFGEVRAAVRGESQPQHAAIPTGEAPGV